ncbi:MAG: SpoIIE family protein phosphatase [Cetobacterium sp.]|uniref:SpoIIE family protein phosphatase n=1 Tax=Cetobacterium sp. TaxID=2071632 RepID=UPI003F2FE95E
MITYFAFIILSFIFFLIIKKMEKRNFEETSKILKSFISKEFLDDLSEDLKNDYERATAAIKKQDLELDNSIEELKDYKKELEVTYESLLTKSKQLEYSNQVLEQRVASLSNINSLSKTVLSIMELDKIISTILDAYFVLTGAKRISLYLWEDGKLQNKRIKGDIYFKGELSYPEEVLSQFTRKDYKNVYIELLKGFPLTCDEKIIASPLNVKGKELGVIFIIEDKSKLIKSDEETISALTIQVAIAINNAQIYSDLVIKERMSQELEVASRIQKRIIPKKIQKVLGLDVATFFEPAKEIGGDYYDYSLLNEKIFSITIADVSGKGVPAAFLMALVRSVLKTLELQGEEPCFNVKKLNKLIYPDITEDMFITMMHSKYNYDTKILTYSNAGHNPLVVYNSLTQSIESHSVKGVAIGFLDDYNYKQGEIKLNIGDVVIYYTDGITEAENINKDLFGIERLKNILMETSSLSSKEIKKRLLAEVNSFQNGCEQNDDITFVVIKRDE